MEISIPSYWQELFRTEKGTVYQSDRERCLWIEFQGQRNAYSIRCFKQLKKQLTQVDLNAMVYNLSADYDYQLISTPHKTLKLNLCELFQLKSLVEGAWVMLELNSIINERLYPLTA